MADIGKIANFAADILLPPLGTALSIEAGRKHAEDWNLRQIQISSLLNAVQNGQIPDDKHEEVASLINQLVGGKDAKNSKIVQGEKQQSIGQKMLGLTQLAGKALKARQAQPQPQMQTEVVGTPSGVPPVARQIPPVPQPRSATFGGVMAGLKPVPQIQSEQRMNEYRQKSDIDLQKEEENFSLRKSQAERMGLKPGTAEYNNAVWGATISPHTSVFEGKPEPDPNQAGKWRIPLIDRSTGDIMSYRAAAGPNTKPAEVLQPKGGGEPYGVKRDGINLLPGDEGWTDADQKLLTSAVTSYRNQQKNIETRMERSMAWRAEAYQRFRPYPVYTADGNARYATGADIAKNPDQYSPLTPSLQIRNKDAIFHEIDWTAEQVDKSIKDLGPEGFTPEARAQAALVLRATDPRSALQEFLRSSFADTLSPKQVDYITGLVSLQESAMSLRSIAGMGQGSDMLRGAITAMLPGAGTPSKKYAERQMNLFRGEVNQLRTALPGLPGQPSGGPGAAAQRTKGGTTPPVPGTTKKNSHGDTVKWNGKAWQLVQPSAQ